MDDGNPLQVIQLEIALDTAGVVGQDYAKVTVACRKGRKRGMTEGLENLEKKISGLITQYRDAKQRIRELETQVRDKSDTCERLEQDNDGLRGRIRELESEVSNRGEREELVKNKLEHIIGQIDSLETEIAQIEAAG